MVSLAPPFASKVIALSPSNPEYKPIPPISEFKLIEAVSLAPLLFAPVPLAALSKIVSAEPTLDVREIAEAILSLDEILTCPEAISISLRAAPSKSIPPAVEVILIALSPSP